MFEYQDLKEQAVTELLSVLTEGGVITESQAKRIPITAEILNEQKFLVENTALETFSVGGIQRGTSIHEVFTAWNDLRNDTAAKLVDAIFGIKSTDRRPAGEVLKRVMQWYCRANPMNRQYGLPPLPETTGQLKDIIRFAHTHGKARYADVYAMDVIYEDSNGYAVFDETEAGRIRKRHNQNQNRDFDDFGEVFNFEYEQARDPFVRGTPGRDSSRAGMAAERINDLELMAGELYTNMTRIPRPAVFKWLNLFKKDVSRFGLPPDKRLTNTWKKVFIVGYQIEERMLFEIWFNTIDSKYTLHDYFGNEMNKRVPTMNEAVRLLMNAAVKFSKDDVEFFKNPANRSIADSFFKPLLTDTDSYIGDMMKREKEQYAKERESAEKARARFYADAESREKAEREDKEASRKRQEELKKRADEITKKAKQLTYKSIMGAKSGIVDAGVAASGAMSKAVRDTMAAHEKERREISFGSITAAEAKSSDWTFFKTDTSKAIELAARELDPDAGRAILKELFIAGTIDEKEVAKAKGMLALITKVMTHTMNGKLNSSAVFAVINSNAYRHGLPEKIRNILKDVVTQMKSKSSRSVTVKESFDEDDFISNSERMHELGVVFDEDVMNPQFQRQIDNSREQARRDSATFKLIQKTIMGSITKYNDTKLKQAAIKNMIAKNLGKHNLNRSFFDKVRKFFKGQTERADFQIGYSLNDRVFYEIWQITQANPEYDGFDDMRKTLTGLYLFDVTAGVPKLIRGSMPYLRNAEQALLQVAGVVGR